MPSIYQVLQSIDYEKLILYIFISTCSIQLFYYLYFYIRLGIADKQISPIQNKHPLSVVICAKNEAINLEKYIPKIMSQRYVDFEVVVVNDCSSDDTIYVLMRLSQQYKNLRFTTIHEDWKFKHGKKLALTVGIKSAKHEYIVLTDADCFPESDMWLQNISNSITDKKTICLGYGGFQERKGLLDKFIRYDALVIAQNYLSFAKAGLPYMGVGRNLAYKKSLFFENKGFASHYGIKSGDDDLFINEVSSAENTSVCLKPDSYTRTIEKPTFKAWFLQKKRHITTAKRYKFHQKLLLGLEPLSRLLFYTTSITFFTLGNDTYFWWILGAIVIKEITQLIAFKLAMHRLTERNLLLYSLVFDIIHPLFYGLLNVSNYATRRRNGNKS